MIVFGVTFAVRGRFKHEQTVEWKSYDSAVLCYVDSRMILQLLRYFPVNPTYPSDIVSSRLSSQLVFPTRPVNLLNSVGVLVLSEFTYEKCAFFG